MPANRVVETAYVGPFASIDVVNSATNYMLGQLGIRVCTADGKQFQFGQLDTGALTSATNGQVLYWKDKANYVFTNNNAFSIGGANGAPNEVAGIATTTVTAGYFTFIQQAGRHTAVAGTSTTYTAGQNVVGHASTTAVINQVNIGTAPPNQAIGVVRTTVTGTSVDVDLAIEGIP